METQARGLEQLLNETVSKELPLRGCSVKRELVPEVGLGQCKDYFVVNGDGYTIAGSARCI